MRKLLLLTAVHRDVIEKQANAIIKICGPPSHDNITAVQQISEIWNTSYYFIDMELCDLNLHQYICGMSFRYVIMFSEQEGVCGYLAECRRWELTRKYC